MNPHSTRRIILLIGSNIEPIKNIRLAFEEIKNHLQIENYSSIWETKPIGSSGYNFLNLALSLLTDIDYDSLKFGLFRSIEAKYGRVRTADKFAPRTIDIDIVIEGEIIREESVWEYAYLAVPVAELVPDLIHPISGIKLIDVARELTKTSWIIKYPAGI
jgi:2-amino-4-hydroxy-6-hydroxymethyldihydropteridine diphosphokinase